MTLLLDAPAVVTPRVANWPAYGASAGREAIELAASAGLVADEWQAWIIERALGLRDDDTWAAFEVGAVIPRQNGKGALTEIRELAGLFWFGEKLILHSAHEFKTAQEAFTRVVAIIENSDDLRKRVSRIRKSDGEEGIELFSGGRLRFVARSTGSGRGFAADCVILDEAFALTPKHMAALLPTLSARPNPQIWYTSTPPQEPTALLSALRRRGVAGAPRLAYFEYSPPLDFRPTPSDEPSTVADRAMWLVTNPAMGIRIAEEFVESERAALPDGEFWRERLGIWPSATSDAPISLQAWQETAADRKRPAKASPFFFLDVEPGMKSGSIGAAFGVRDVPHGELADHRLGTDWLVARAVELKRAYPRAVFAVETLGAASTLLPVLAEAGIEPERFAAADMGRACSHLQKLVGDRAVTHSDDPLFGEALAGAVKIDRGEGLWTYGRRKSTTNISPLVAVTGALWLLRLNTEKPKPMIVVSGGGG
jgi:phage terminase large subunit-like protein